MSKSITTYVLMISEKFPAKHPKANELTGFALAIKHYTKIHTIRDNYELWVKRFEKINAGKAVLSVRGWSGKPYQSKQYEYYRYDNTHGIGIQKIDCNPLGWVIDDELNEELKTETLALNDGLELLDFRDWFKGKFNINSSAGSKVIIHFTDFRY